MPVALAFLACLIPGAAAGCASRSQFSSTLDYYPYGNLRRYSDAEGGRTSFEYDLMNQVTSVVYPDRERVEYGYDANGNVVEIDGSSEGAYRYAYDSSNRVTKAVRPDGKALSYVYDLVGNLEKLTYPGGLRVDYAYNANNWLTKVSQEDRSVAYQHDRSGTIAKIGLPNGVAVRMAHAGNGQLMKISYLKADGTPFLGLSYELDVLGNVIRLTREAGSEGRETAYRYDSLSRLVAVDYPGGKKVTYRYDGTGNRLSAETNGKVIDYTYDTLGLLTKAGEATFRYDRNGNLIEKKESGKRTRYSFDGRGQLVGVVLPDGSRTESTYDVLGRRTSKTDSHGTVRYVYDGDNLIQELDGRGQTLASYVYGKGVDHPISMLRGGRTYYYLYDRLGSVIGLLDERGETAATYQYDAWGNITKESGDVENPFRFTSREWDGDTGLYFYRARYYDPEVGRFLSKDPYPGDLRNPQSFNGYTYIRNNPASLVDPFGREPSVPGPQVTVPSWWRFFFHALEVRGGAVPLLFKWYGNYGGPGRVNGRTGVYTENGFFPRRGDPAWVPPRDDRDWAYYFHDCELKDAGFIPGKELRQQARRNADRKLAATLNALNNKYGNTAVEEALFAGRILFGSPNDNSGLYLGDDASLPDWEEGVLSAGNRLRTAATAIADAVKVGGVLLDETADVQADLDEITGAYYDEGQGQLVLTGRVKGASQERRVPRMNKDDLSVAIRAIYSGEAPGVSIDPPRSYRARGVFPPEGTPMPTRFLGNTKNTHFGSVMFEADRLLKNLSMGQDNKSGKKVSSEVAGFRNELSLSMKQGGGGSRSWHRMWFMIEDMRLDLNVKETRDRNALAFSEASLRVQTEYLGRQGSDPAAETFARHFTAHYDDFAGEYPVLERLRELAKIVSIVKFLKDSDKPIDLFFLDSFETSFVPTPDFTPGIRVSRSRTGTSGSTRYRKTHMLFGGVSFDFPYRTGRDDGKALALRDAARSARPSKAAADWNFRLHGETQRAIVISLFDTGKSSSVVRQTDISKDSGSNLKLELRRRFDLSNVQPSVFGFGWELEAPVKLLFLDRNKTVRVGGRKFASTVYLLDRKNGGSSKYYLGEGKRAYSLVTRERTRRHGKVTSVQLELDPGDVIRPASGGGFAWESDEGVVHRFDSEGRLTSAADGSGRVDYVYRNNRIDSVSGVGGRLRFAYDNKGRVSQVDAPGGERLSYSYDAAGDLRRVASGRGLIASYVYNRNHRLAEIKNGNGKITRLAPVTRTAKKAKEVVKDAQGNEIIRLFDNQDRLARETDSLGNSFNYEYNGANRLTKVESNRGQVWRLGYDREGRMTSLVNPLGQNVKLGYDRRGNLSRLVDARGGSAEMVFNSANRLSEVREGTTGRVAAFDYDRAGRVLAAVDAKGGRASFSYSADGRTVGVRDALGLRSRLQFDTSNRLVRQTNPAGHTTTYAYDAKGNLSRLANPEGSNKYNYDSHGNLVRMVDAAGNETRFGYGKNNRLLKVIDAEGGVTAYGYDARGNLTVITDANGMRTEFTYDIQGRLTAVGARAAESKK